MNLLVPLVDEKFKEQREKDSSEVLFKAQFDGFDFSAYLHIKKNTDKLFILLNGALAKDRKTSLTYHRWNWHERFPGSVLYIADPTLFKYPDAFLAWYIGDEQYDIAEQIFKFVNQVRANLGVAADKTVAYGSSGGGYAALQMASKIGHNALAVCINSQVNALDYDEHIQAYLDICWGGRSISSLRDNIRFNATAAVKAADCKVLYVQNIVDDFHYKKHFLPFLQQVAPQLDVNAAWAQQRGRVRTIVYDHESGHAAEPKELLPGILEAVNELIVTGK